MATALQCIYCPMPSGLSSRRQPTNEEMIACPLQVILASVSPILTKLPKWIELGAYLEFGDDEVRLCEACHNVCEWVYFKLLQYK